MDAPAKHPANGIGDSRPVEARTERSNGSAAPVAVLSLSAPPEPPESLGAGLLRKPGRPRGSVNKTTKEVRHALRGTLPKAKRRLKALVENDDAEVAFRAVSLVFAYSYGKPTEHREITGAEGGPQLIEFLRDLPG